MQTALLTKFIQKNKRTDTPVFRPGDTIRVHVKIKERRQGTAAGFRRYCNRAQ